MICLCVAAYILKTRDFVLDDGRGNIKVNSSAGEAHPAAVTGEGMFHLSRKMGQRHDLGGWRSGLLLGRGVIQVGRYYSRWAVSLPMDHLGARIGN